MRLIAKLIYQVLSSKGDPGVIEQTRKKVEELVKAFPLYPELGE